MPAVINAIDIMTSSSAFGEGFSNAIAEAMACGVPCVATDVGDSAFVIGDVGIVVPRENPSALADAWAQLLAIDPGRWRSMKAAVRQRIESEFAVSRLVERTERALAGLYTAPR
jgi:glycosyltransferase involved in cell wall biosynthesis